MPKNLSYITCIIASVILLFSFNKIDEKARAKPAPVQKKIEAKVLTVNKEEYKEYFTAYGEIQNEDQMNLSFQVGGKIESLNVIEGQRVKKGTALISLNNSQQRSSLDQLNSEKNKINLAINNLRLEKDNIAKNVEATTKLFNAGYATAEEKEQLEFQLNIVENKLKAQEEGVKTLESQLEMADYNASLYVLKAPYNGIVENVNVKPFEVVGAGQSLIQYSSNSIQPVIQLNLNAKEISKMKEGQTASVYVEYPEAKIYQGIVQTVNTYKSARTYDYNVTIAFDCKGDRLIYGSVVKVDVMTSRKTIGHKIPLDAIENIGNNYMEVLTIDADSTVRQIRSNYIKINNEFLIMNQDVDQFDLVVDKSIGLKANDKVDEINYALQ